MVYASVFETQSTCVCIVGTVCVLRECMCERVYSRRACVIFSRRGERHSTAPVRTKVRCVCLCVFVGARTKGVHPLLLEQAVEKAQNACAYLQATLGSL